MNETKNRVVSARVTEAEYRQLMIIAKALTPPGEVVKVSVPVRDAIRKYLQSYETA